VNIVEILCMYVYIYGKMRPVETILGMGRGMRDKGE
jgi:hypothetical protein